jgi:NAD+ kinase
MDSSRPERIALVVHPHRPEALSLARRAKTWWSERGFEVAEYGEHESGAADGLPDGGVRFAVSLGGDGTLLRTVQLVLDEHVPVLGVNLGHLGYLTQVEPDGMEAAFEHLVAGTYVLEERMSLEVLVGRAEDVPTHRPAGESSLRRLVGLNEASLEKTAPGHTIRFSVEIGGHPFLTYAADGLLVSTPTGSTAYNLSLRGPLLSPHLRALVVTPISPHMLFDRALVLGADEPVRIRLLDDRPALLVVDGGPLVPLGSGDAVLVSSGSVPVPIVRIGNYDFHRVLRHKFNLADR